MQSQRIDPDNPLLQVHNLQIEYNPDRLPAIENINLQISKGEKVAVIGKSGCGKTTLLKAIAGLLPLGNNELRWHYPQTLNSTAYVFQEPALMPWLSIQKNIELPLKMRGAGTEKRQKISDQLLHEVSLEHRADSLPGELSVGMQMRISLGRALSIEPALLLLDEPFAALDAITRQQMNRLLLRLTTDHRMTVILVTHSIPEAIMLADRIVVMTGSPGTVSQVVEINAPRNRLQAWVNSPRFMQYYLELEEAIEA